MVPWTQTAPRSVQAAAVFAGLTSVTDRPTDRVTDRPIDHASDATRSVTIGRIPSTYVPRPWNSLPVQLRNPDITYGLFTCTTAEGTPFSGSMNTIWRSVTLICGALEEHLLTYLLRSTAMRLNNGQRLGYLTRFSALS